jgi:hypothetical protein
MSFDTASSDELLDPTEDVTPDGSSVEEDAAVVRAAQDLEEARVFMRSQIRAHDYLSGLSLEELIAQRIKAIGTSTDENAEAGSADVDVVGAGTDPFGIYTSIQNRDGTTLLGQLESMQERVNQSIEFLLSKEQ